VHECMCTRHSPNALALYAESDEGKRVIGDDALAARTTQESTNPLLDDAPEPGADVLRIPSSGRGAKKMSSRRKYCEIVLVRVTFGACVCRCAQNVNTTL
jgi:hypothetical protein